MKNITLSLLFIFSGFIFKGQDLLKGKESTLSFFSTTPLEDISAKNKQVVVVIKPSTGAIQMQAKNLGFTFERPLMQEHFNENYMESEKYPTSSFSGKIIGSVNYLANGVTPVTAKGKLTIHGVTKDVDVKGKITVSNGKITLDAKFPVKVADYGIKVPTIVTKKIAESVDVTVFSELIPSEANKK
ncbi:MAG: YceI family protein [Bacteroidota bacterium]|jgi:hypothetical protein